MLEHWGRNSNTTNVGIRNCMLGANMQHTASYGLFPFFLPAGLMLYRPYRLSSRPVPYEVTTLADSRVIQQKSKALGCKCMDCAPLMRL